MNARERPRRLKFGEKSGGFRRDVVENAKGVGPNIPKFPGLVPILPSNLAISTEYSWYGLSST